MWASGTQGVGQTRGGVDAGGTRLQGIETLEELIGGGAGQRDGSRGEWGDGCGDG